MNRSILIVICDFLLVSLLAFSTADINSTAQGTAAPVIKTDLAMNPATNQMGARQDLGDVMRLALIEERKNREVLLAELTATRGTATRQQELLNQRNAQIQSVQEQLQSTEEQARRLQTQQTNLEAQLTAAQTNAQALNQRLQASTEETLYTQEQRAVLEAETRKQMEKISALQAQLADLQRNHQAGLLDKERLLVQLETAESEKRAASVQLARAEEEVAAQRKANANLAEGVKTLAANSSALTEEIRQDRLFSANAIFDDVVSNRDTAVFVADRPGFFGQEVSKVKQTRTVLVTDGTNVFALCHVHDTPFNLWNPGTDWHELSATLSHGSLSAPLSSLIFSLTDPRIVVMPVASADAHRLASKVYNIAADPGKFQDAVVIGTSEDYYGECKFQIDLTTPMYLRMDRHTLNGLFGRFNPSSGDLVFSKSGQFLGIMANSTYCARIHGKAAAAAFNLGPGARDQGTADTLASLYTVTAELPLKLQ
jgi:hypothetical protein